MKILQIQKTLLTLLLGSVLPVQADSPVLQEWDVPWDNTRPRDPFVAPDGKVWFCGQAGEYLARFDPETEKFTRYDLGPGSGPHNLIVDARGMVWYAGNRLAHIGRLDPASGDVRKYPMPDSAVKDPHTLVFDDAGDIWFTAQVSNYVGKLTVSSGAIDLVPVPSPQARPYGIRIDSNGRPWVALFGTNKLASINPQTLAITEYELPRTEARPRRLAITSDNRIWYVDYAGGYLGNFNPATNEFQEVKLPGGDNARPYGMAADRQDRLWLVETGNRPNRFIGYDTTRETFLEGVDIPSGGGTVRHMYYHRPTDTIWFGTDTNYLGKAVLP